MYVNRDLIYIDYFCTIAKLFCIYVHGGYKTRLIIITIHIKSELFALTVKIFSFNNKYFNEIVDLNGHEANIYYIVHGVS